MGPHLLLTRAAVAALAIVASTLAMTASPRARAGVPLPEPGLPLGPVLGNLSYHGDLLVGVEGEDTDEFAGRLAEGELLSVRIRVPFSSGLYPALDVVGPDGLARPVDVRSRKLGRDLEIRAWPVPETGIWTVRVRPLLQTFGAYDLRLAVIRARTVRVDVDADDDGTPAVVDVPVHALAGSKLDVRVTARGRGPAPVIEALVGPTGADVRDDAGALAVESAEKRRGRLTLAIDALPAGDGLYVVRVGAPAGHGALAVTASVVSPPRAKGKRKLSKSEPFLDVRKFPIRGVKERSIRLAGRNFASSATVLFGDTPGTEVFVDPSGTFLDVHPPQLVEGSTSRIAVVNPDGQAYERDAYFYYVPTPRLEDLVDRQGATVRGASTAGGRVVRFVGANFQTGVFLTFGASGDVLPQILSETMIEAVVPPGEAGEVEVHLFDAYLHDVQPPFLFEYKAPPTFAASPYTPATALTDGTTIVDIAGDGFGFADEVIFDGEAVPTTWLSPFGLRFTVPATTAGTHRIGVRDRVGTVANGPDLTVTEP